MSNIIYSSKYYNLYHKIVNKYKHLDLKKYNGLYLEKHHIVPRCIGGLDTKDNLVNIPAREHFLLHWMLCRIYKLPKLYHAFKYMTSINPNQDKRYTSKSFKYARELSAKAFIGFKHSEESRLKISKAGMNRIISDETRIKLSKPKPPFTDIHRTNISEKGKAVWKLKPVLYCPFCNFETKSISALKRYHFSNCKLLPIISNP